MMGMIILQHANNHATVLGLCLLGSGCAKHQVEVFAHMGLCPSYVTTLRHVKKLSAEGVTIYQQVAQDYMYLFTSMGQCQHTIYSGQTMLEQHEHVWEWYHHYPHPTSWPQESRPLCPTWDTATWDETVAHNLPLYHWSEYHRCWSNSSAVCQTHKMLQVAVTKYSNDSYQKSQLSPQHSWTCTRNWSNCLASDYAIPDERHASWWVNNWQYNSSPWCNQGDCCTFTGSEVASWPMGLTCWSTIYEASRYCKSIQIGNCTLRHSLIL